MEFKCLEMHCKFVEKILQSFVRWEVGKQDIDD